jgi:hypothetical protein
MSQKVYLAVDLGAESVASSPAGGTPQAVLPNYNAAETSSGQHPAGRDQDHR